MGCDGSKSTPGVAVPPSSIANTLTVSRESNFCVTSSAALPPSRASRVATDRV